MRSYEEYKEKVLKDNPEVKAEYDALQPEFDIIQATIDEKNEQNPADGENDGDEMSDFFPFWRISTQRIILRSATKSEN